MISFRNFKESDKETVLAWRNSPEIADHMYGDHEISTEEHGAWFDSLDDNTTNQYWIIVQDDRDVGVVYIFDIDRKDGRAYWGFYLADDAGRGKGVGYFVEIFTLIFVFEYLGLNKLCCEVIAKNESVWRMHLKIGFSKEGLLKSQIRKNGRFRDVVILGMLQDEWEKLKPTHLQRLERRKQTIPNFKKLSSLENANF